MTCDQHSISWIREQAKALDAVFFNGELFENGLTIEWMKYRRTTRNITLGLYRREKNRIELHRNLTYGWVPWYVVFYVVFHEMLHARFTDDHDALFKLAEDKFPHLREACEWIRDHFNEVRDAEQWKEPRKSRKKT